MNRTLKDQNAARLITIWALNAFFFLWIFLDWRISADNWQSLLLGPLGVVLASIVNGLVGSDTKASIVFWRWNHPLPGTRVFSELIKCDNRIDQSRAELQIRGIFNLPPDEQNILWFEYYASVQANPLVISSERGYLFYRDYVSMLVIFSIPALFLWILLLRKRTWHCHICHINGHSVPYCKTGGDSNRKSIRNHCGGCEIRSRIQKAE